MKIERVRSILGVWMPMAIGLLIILTSINFYFTASLVGNPFLGDFESWRLVCSAGAFFVGGVLLLSTYGRYKKTQDARRGTAPPSVVPASTPTRNEQSHDEDNHRGDAQ